ncbi:MAG: hypothetical protein M3342_12235 [Bacteroidota bacterium]|nr:hypothetical protein [Flavisolibacter sp.]MDQ3844767.1 hypothetical protein [Bacteroidota bacterium]
MEPLTFWITVKEDWKQYVYLVEYKKPNPDDVETKSGSIADFYSFH